MSEPKGRAAFLADLARQEAQCTRCPLYREATRAVPREGNRKATLMFVGEQPGDQEDLAGKPFVGPAGHVFDEALTEAGIERTFIFITNAAKHFKFEPRGKKRLHKRPNGTEAYHSWCHYSFGSDRCSQLARPPMSVSSLRGRAVTLEDGTPLVGTVHPSYLLRIRNAADRADARRGFIADLVRSRKLVDARTPEANHNRV